MTATQTPATQNAAWGFWGTMEEHAPAAWPLALQAICAATAQPLDDARAFLDSRHGRHFADSVRDALARGQALPKAIDTATAQWMTWGIGRTTSRQHGIPRGLPYLTGFVAHCGIAQAA